MVFVISAIIISIDQLTKLLVSSRLSLGESIAVLPPVLSLSLVHNRGAAFGLMKGQVPLFIIFSLVAVVLIARDLKSKGPGKVTLYDTALSLILAGAVGNLIDRWRLGYVIDFLDLHVWPVFNIADSAITIGALLLGWTILKGNDRKCIRSSAK